MRGCWVDFSLIHSCEWNIYMYVFHLGDNVWAQIKKYKEKIATRRANGDFLLTDITDGAEYVKLCQEEGFLSHPSNISFLVNTGTSYCFLII